MSEVVVLLVVVVLVGRRLQNSTLVTKVVEMRRTRFAEGFDEIPNTTPSI